MNVGHEIAVYSDTACMHSQQSMHVSWMYLIFLNITSSTRWGMGSWSTVSNHHNEITSHL